MPIRVLVALLLVSEVAAAAPPIKAPIATVQKQFYLKHPRPRTAAMAGVGYVGPGKELMEWRATQTKSDVLDDLQFRWSTDNGRTWSAFARGAKSTHVDYQGVAVWEGGICRCYDPASGRLVELWLRQIEIAGVEHKFTYVRTSGDLGRTWSMPEQLRYEPGESFDARQPLRPSFLHRNQCFGGSAILVRHDGALVCPMAHASAPHDADDQKRVWKLGSLCFIGRWDKQRKAYRWAAGERVAISAETSARGLMEPDLAELRDRRLLVVWRGSDTRSTAGRKWFSISRDGGKTLSPVREWRYSDGSRFYSPSSCHRLIRHSVTGKLYWIGNICGEPPKGNAPRYPLVIAEVDDASAAMKRETVTVIDDRSPAQSPAIQFSNFSLLENRETHHLELYLTTYGQEANPRNWASADNYKYTVTLR